MLQSACAATLGIATVKSDDSGSLSKSKIRLLECAYRPFESDIIAYRYESLVDHAKGVYS